MRNRARIEEIWRYYIEKWAKFGSHVVWQLCLRGKTDLRAGGDSRQTPMLEQGKWKNWHCGDAKNG